MLGHNQYLPKEYLNDVLVRLAHHSTAIEGNTISLADTVTILLYNTVPSGVQLRELYEIDNHKEAFHYVLNSVDNNEALTIDKMLDFHELLMNKLLHHKGKFKTGENAIQGADFLSALVRETPRLMRQWVNDLNWQLDNTKDRNKILEIVGYSHIQFERIHPFTDGNGRTGRLLINYSLLQRGLLPLVIIEAKNKSEYINILAKQDPKAFRDFALPIIDQEEERFKRFMNKELSHIKTNDVIPLNSKQRQRRNANLER
ncbi:Fic family protein [Fictibacillus solisalsi]|uniref:Fic family protein n=1 Tax=Fictibacillus solisalsi TaxID=459525 RepID=A0A1H0BND0_9BACL|nr:Fic family protein [Fictibacillus solisalsi]SDN47131.1 Fic family protein [Fictibacillus solisalsi]